MNFGSLFNDYELKYQAVGSLNNLKLLIYETVNVCDNLPFY